MDKDLRKYLKVYDTIPAKMCEEILVGLAKANWRKHFYQNAYTNEQETFDTDLSVTHEDVPHKNDLMGIVWNGLKQYMDDIGFAWFDSWNGFTYVRFNRYEEGQKMNIHCDHIHTVFKDSHSGIPTLTILGCLNEGYQGGELIFWEDEKVDLPAGSIMIFPSNFLYPHEVLPVTYGTRYSFVSWAF